MEKIFILPSAGGRHRQESRTNNLPQIRRKYSGGDADWGLGTCRSGLHSGLREVRDASQLVELAYARPPYHLWQWPVAMNEFVRGNNAIRSNHAYGQMFCQ